MNSDVIPFPSDVVIHQPAGAVAASFGRVCHSNLLGSRQEHIPMHRRQFVQTATVSAAFSPFAFNPTTMARDVATPNADATPSPTCRPGSSS
jgi:hypothetical protein